MKLLGQRFKIKIISLVTALFLLLTPNYHVHAKSLLNEIGLKLKDVNDQALLPGVEAGSLPDIIGKAISAMLIFLATLFLIIVIYGGFLWMTAGGNPEQTKKAGAYLRNGAIGLAIIFVSYAITLFVFNVLAEATKAG